MSESPVTLHFAHANGFPAASYNEVFKRLPKHWQILAKPMFGHDPALPVGRNWENQVAELLEYVKVNRQGTKVYAVGHSFGAIISFMAACEQPDYFAGLIVIDPPLVLGPGSWLLRGAKLTSYIDKITPAKLAQNRNSQWQADSDLVSYFQQKALFKNMQPACVADYVAAATHHEEGRISLSFRPDVEADIFRNVPHNLDRYKGRLQCPGLLITGAESVVCKPKHWQRFVQQNRIEQTSLPGGHMLPLEFPQDVADRLTKTINRWAAIC